MHMLFLLSSLRLKVILTRCRKISSFIPLIPLVVYSLFNTSWLSLNRINYEDLQLALFALFLEKRQNLKAPPPSWLTWDSIRVKTGPVQIHRLGKLSHIQTEGWYSSPCSNSETASVLHTLTTHYTVQHSQHNHLLICKRASVDFDKGQIAFHYFPLSGLLLSPRVAPFVTHLLLLFFTTL